MNISTFSCNFHGKSEFYVFYNFSRRVTKNTLGFCHPSNAFQPQTKLPRGSLIFYPQNAFWGDFIDISPKWHHFHQNGGFGVILALSAPRARKHINSLSYLELFEVPWEPKWSFSPNSTHFHENRWNSPKISHFHHFSPFYGNGVKS